MDDRATTDASEFDRATAVRVRSDGSGFDTEIDAGWTVGPKPNGGYLLALAARAAAEVAVGAGADHPDPLVATAHYLRAPDPGPAEVTGEVLRLGRSASQIRTVIRQGDKACVDATFTMGHLPEDPPQPWWTGLTPPALPPIEECVRLPSSREGAPFTVAIMDRTDLRMDPAVLGFASGAPGGGGDLRGWISFADGRPIDPLGLLFIVDSFPPATFELAATGWVPTLSLTAYVRARPAPGPLRVSQRVQMVADDRVDEVCEAWDSADCLVAHATQLAGIRIEPGTRVPPRP